MTKATTKTAKANLAPKTIIRFSVFPSTDRTRLQLNEQRWEHRPCKRRPDFALRSDFGTIIMRRSLEQVLGRPSTETEAVRQYRDLEAKKVQRLERELVDARERLALADGPVTEDYEWKAGRAHGR